jgi:hypothetical protein
MNSFRSARNLTQLQTGNLFRTIRLDEITHKNIPPKCVDLLVKKKENLGLFDVFIKPPS